MQLVSVGVLHLAIINLFISQYANIIVKCASSKVVLIALNPIAKHITKLFFPF